MAKDPENWAGEATPRSVSNRLRSLFKHRAEVKVPDDKEEELYKHKGPVPKDISDSVNCGCTCRPTSPK